jgi:hypothetical protein
MVLAAHHDVEQQTPCVAFWNEAAICAASVGDMIPGRNATRNLRCSLTWLTMASMIQASSHQAPVGVSAASKPSCSALRAIWPR